MGSEEQRAISADVPDGSVMRMGSSLAPLEAGALPWPELDPNLAAVEPRPDTLWSPVKGTDSLARMTVAEAARTRTRRTHMTRLTITSVTAALAAAALLVGCGGDDGADTADVAAEYTVVRDATLAPGDPVPAPTGEVVLTITGAISTTNTDGALELDLELLESLQLVEYTTSDLQAEGGDATFTGVLLEDVLALAGAEDSTTLTATALNDYRVDIPTADLEFAVMVATSVNGERMPVERYGPTRIVYPYGSGELDPAVYDPRWIWQLASIEVI